jgi:hypothetical protein
MSYDVIQFITTNISAAVRNEQLEGRDHLVVPMVMITEGVHQGTQGRLFYPADELAKSVSVWNHKPIVVYHPTMNGVSISACDPDVINNRKVGVVLNTRWDGKKLRAEAWIDIERAKLVDNRILEFIDASRIMEVSTGLYTENELKVGAWNSEIYDAIARNYKPDHLALLPDQVGACSVADGAGLLQLNQDRRATYIQSLVSSGASVEKATQLVDNELSHDNIRNELRQAAIAKLGGWVWIRDVYDSFFVYEHELNELPVKLYKCGYHKTDTEVSLDDSDPVEVKQVTEYRTIDGVFVGNFYFEAKEIDMEKKQIVDGLIANTATNFEESDREFLMGLDEAQLTKLQPKPVQNVEKTDVQKAAERGAAELNSSAAPVQNQLSDEDREDLAFARQIKMQRKQEAIATIIANKNNDFSTEELGQMQLPRLEKMAKLASIETPEPNYAGAAGPTSNTSKREEEPLGLPVMNFSK